MTNHEDNRSQSSSSDDTQPRRPVNFPPLPPRNDYGGVAAPPRILLWGVIIVFVMGIVGAGVGVYIFRDVLEPGQQVRVMNILPFMEAFLPPRPGPDDTLPTTVPVDDAAAQDLLNLTLPDHSTDATEAATEEIVAPTTTRATIVPETPTSIATESPTAMPNPTATPVPSTPEEVGALSQTESPNAWPIAAYNTGFRHEQQTWNNCGPANITMALSYFGWQQDQTYAADRLKPSREDKNVSPDELVRFVNENTGVKALTRMGGDLDLLRLLVANEFPVIVERGHMFGGYDWLGHYQTLVGYNDAQHMFYIYDSFLGIGDSNEGITEAYAELDAHWRDFNRTFIVVYHPSHEAYLMDLLADRADPIGAAEHAFSVAQAEASANPQDSFAWFNMGSSLTALGRYTEAAVAFDRATEGGLPWRMLWYQFGLFEAYFEVKRYDDVLNYVNANLANGGEYVEETYYWQGRALAAKGRTAEAAEAFRNALRHNRLFAPAQTALNALQ
jgi:hypothetical protein